MAKPIIVILGHSNDPCARGVDQLLRQRGIEVLFVEEAQCFTTAGLNWSVLGSPDESFLTSGSARIPWAALSGVFVRLQGHLHGDLGSSDPEQWYMACERHAALVGLLNSLDCQVINRPPPGVPWRLLQSRRLPWICGEKVPLITQHGFKLPRMVVTSSEKEACRHYACFGRAALIDSPSGQGPWQWIAGEVGEREIQAMLARHPLRLLEAPAGQWIEVFTVGKSAFGASGRVDLRTEEDQGQRLSAVLLTAELQARCWGLAQAFGLDFAQLSLLLTGEGDTHCMGIGEWPNCDHCEAPLQEQIAAALTDLFEGTACPFWAGARGAALAAPVAGIAP